MPRSVAPKGPVETEKPASRAAPRTPLNIRLSGVGASPDVLAYMRERIGRRLGKFAAHIQRVTLRFEDANGPRGGADKVCRIKAVLNGFDSILTEDRAETVRVAFDKASHRCVRAVQKALSRAGATAPAQRRRGQEKPSASAPKRSVKPSSGSIVGRRVGRSDANIAKAAARPEKKRRDAYVDTSQPGVSATDRRAGAGHTARRNTKTHTGGAVATLEDSEQARPSRKSTRKSANRAKQDDALRRRQTTRAGAPSTRARKAAKPK
jgi:ribosome-associated translation inhibitor RaiA